MERALPGGGKLESITPKRDLKRLNTKHLIIAKLSAMGWANKAIAEYVEYSENYISLVLKTPLVKRRVQYYSDLYLNGDADAIKEMKKLTEEAVEVVGQLLYDEDLSPKERARIAFEIMDRGGVPKRVDHNIVNTHLTVDEIKELTRNARASGVNIVSDDIEEALVLDESKEQE